MPGCATSSSPPPDTVAGPPLTSPAKHPPAIIGLKADPNGDGIANLIAYALGLAPMILNQNPVQFDQEAIGADTYLRLNVTRDPSATGVTIAGPVSQTLAVGGWTSIGLVIETDMPTLFQVRDNVLIGSANRRFMRLHFSQL